MGCRQEERRIWWKRRRLRTWGRLRKRRVGWWNRQRQRRGGGPMEHGDKEEFDGGGVGGKVLIKRKIVV